MYVCVHEVVRMVNVENIHSMDGTKLFCNLYNSHLKKIKVLI